MFWYHYHIWQHHTYSPRLQRPSKLGYGHHRSWSTRQFLSVCIASEAMLSISSYSVSRIVSHVTTALASSTKSSCIWGCSCVQTARPEARWGTTYREQRSPPAPPTWHSTVSCARSRWSQSARDTSKQHIVSNASYHKQSKWFSCIHARIYLISDCSPLTPSIVDGMAQW